MNSLLRKINNDWTHLLNLNKKVYTFNHYYSSDDIYKEIIEEPPYGSNTCGFDKEFHHVYNPLICVFYYNPTNYSFDKINNRTHKYLFNNDEDDDDNDNDDDNGNDDDNDSDDEDNGLGERVILFINKLVWKETYSEGCGGISHNHTPQMYLAKSLDDIVNYGLLPDERDMMTELAK